MKNLKIIELGNKIIRTNAKKVGLAEIRTKKFQNFCNNLVFTCKVSNGVGIASPQVGISKRVFILWSQKTKRRKTKIPELGPIVIINPKILSTSKKATKGWEGCLSIPGIRGLVPRHESVEVEFITREGEKVRMKFDGFTARIFQHEFDHLNGIVFLDRTNPKDIVTEKEYKNILYRK